MKKIKITTPENIEIEYTLADLGSRTAAAVIDILIIFAILIVMILVPLIIIYNMVSFIDKYEGWIIGISLIAAFLIYYGYYIVLEMTMNGRTFGKKLLNLRAIRNNGQPITLKHSVIRNLFKVLIDMQGLGAVFIYFNKDRKRIGDMLASTIVVIEENIKEYLPFKSPEYTFSYHFLSDAEKGLLEDYFIRRDELYDRGKEIETELMNYFAKRNVSEDYSIEYNKFLKELEEKLLHNK